MNAKTTNIQFGITRKSLEAMVIHACQQCGAPGVYKGDARTQELWPGCWSAEWHDRPVGDICPNCRQSRIKNRDLGELTASMPKWIWLGVLAFKWCVLTSITLKRTLLT